MNYMNAAPGPRAIKPTLCRYFANNGYCFYGDQCQFSHAKTSSRTQDGDRVFGGPQYPMPMSQPFPGAPMNNGPIGSKGPRGNYKGNNMLLSNATQDRLIANLSSLTVNATKGQQTGMMANQSSPPGGSSTAALSPTKKSFVSSLAPGGPVSPLHSPKPLSSPPKKQGPAMSQSFEYLPNAAANQNLAQGPLQQQTERMEAVGGTTYFYSQPSQEQPAVLLPSHQVYEGEPSHLAHLQNNQTKNNTFSMSAQIRQELIHQHAVMQAQLDPDDPNAPPDVDSYHSLCPLEPVDTPTDQAQSTFGYITTCYKAVNSKDSLVYVLRRIHGFRLVNAKSMVLVDQWKKLSHSNLVSLREVFTTKAFNDNSLIFVYDYHPGAETLLSRHFNGPDSQLPVNADGSLMFPTNGRGGMMGPGRGAKQGVLMPERLIWSYIIQLSSALRAVHAAGLACRVIDPSKILLIGNSRLRINGGGIFDVLSFDASNSPNAMVPHFQQEDLTSLGKLVLALACYSLQAVQHEHIQKSMEYVAMNYSGDLKNLIIYLLSSPPPTHMKSVNDIMPMIGARFYTQLDAAQVKSDVFEGELSKEMEMGRLFRLMCKLGTINERPEFGMDPSWSETGDRYLLKLFRDYLFHQVTETGAPWIDLAHVVSCLNKLDAGSPERICLMSRDEQSTLVVSFRDLKNSIDAAYNEVLAASVV